MVYYLNTIHSGIKFVGSNADGYSMGIRWNKAFPSAKNNKVAYHIYYSTIEKNVFSEGPKFLSVDGSLNAEILDLTPGQIYHFAIRALEYNPLVFDPNNLPDIFPGLKIYPESILRQNISAIDTIIPLLSTETFPNFGIIKAGVELINYLSNDLTNNNLILTNANVQRGFNGTNATIHNTDGYDGYVFWNQTISFVLGVEELNTIIFQCQSRFDLDNYQFTIADGYHQVTKDILTTDLSASDALNEDFPTYDYAGYHRTDPVQLLSGACVGSYFGGQTFCADGYIGVGVAVRGLSFQENNNNRQDYLLSLTGEPVCLVRRQWTGITCECYLPSGEYPDDRCTSCFGSKFVVGWEQFFNPRRSDGRIMVRFSPSDDDIKPYEAGLESELISDVWTLTVPTIKDRDFLIRFDENDNEEFRYEVLSVNRNKTLTRLEGAQKFRVQRIRKFDPLYRVPVFRNTQYLPEKVQTDFGSTTGIPPHKHIIVKNETFPNGVPQLTTVDFGHSHTVSFKNGKLVVDTILGHSHNIII